jgi:hypothetical protein
MSADAAKPAPPVVARFLASNPSLRLLQLADVRDIVDPVGEGQFSPFVEADLTGDSRADAAAVVVQPGLPIRYGVVAFNRSDTGFSARQWIVRLSTERIVGLYVRERRRLDIAYCLECDSNPFVRWDGMQYRASLWVAGDSPATFDRPSKGVTPVELRGSPNEASRIVAKLSECTEVEIVQFVKPSGGGAGWYRVAVDLSGQRHVGFIRGEDLTEVSCVG